MNYLPQSRMFSRGCKFHICPDFFSLLKTLLPDYELCYLGTKIPEAAKKLIENIESNLNGPKGEKMRS